MTAPLPFMEKLPDAVAARLGAMLAPDEVVHLQVTTDLCGLDTFGEQWVVVTSQRLLLLGGPDPQGVEAVPWTEIAGARVEPLVGGGQLHVDRKAAPPLQVYYTSSLGAKFAEVAEGVRRLAEGQELLLATELEASRCHRCRRMLPEKGGVCPACVRKRDTLGRLLAYVRPYRRRAVVLVLLTVSAALLSLAPPYLVKLIIDRALPDRQGFGLLLQLVGGLVGISALSWGAEVTRRWLNTWVGFRAVETIRGELFRALQLLPLRFYDRRKVGSLISRMTNDSDLVEGYLLFDLPFVVSNSLMVIGIIGLLFYLNWRVTIYVLLPVPPIIIAGSLIWGRLQGSWRRWSSRWSRLSSHLNESITGIRVIKGFAQEARESERFDTRNQALRDVTITAERIWLAFFMITNFFMSFGAFFVWYFGGRQVLAGTLSLGELMAFVSYLWMLYGPLRWFGDFYSFMVRAFAGAERIFEVIDARPEPFADPQARPLPKLIGRVAFAGVTFGYDPGKPVLKDIDLQVEPGEMIGLVGRSGAGKSSLIKLICRFYDVNRGTLSIDGVDIRQIRLEDLRRQIGMVAQESFLFNDTIAENIRYGQAGATFDQVLRAARAANAHEFIVQKPDGYDMVVGENGNRLSGGEKQRIAIARAILHDPRILIFDEATSSLDTQTESRIQEAIQRLVAGRTTFAIAHRLSTLRHANRLVVIDEGRVAEVGTHEQLMERQGVFYRLVKTQQETTAVMVTGTDEA